MISFSAEFPVSDSSSVDSVVQCVRVWIRGMRRSKIKDLDLEHIGKTINSINTQNEKLELVALDKDCAIRYVLSDNGVEWRTDIAFSTRLEGKAISIRIYRESKHATTFLPDAKSPVILSIILDTLGPHLDGEIPISSAVREISLSDVGLVANAMWGTCANRLPIVYVSCPFSNITNDYSDLAKCLYGLAHVWVERDRSVSRELQRATEGLNVYGGAVGIYWSDDDHHQCLYMQNYNNIIELIDDVVRIVKNTLLKRKQQHGRSWEDINFKAVVAVVEEERRLSLEEFSEVFDDEVEQLKRAATIAQAEITALKTRLVQSENMLISAESALNDLRQERLQLRRRDHGQHGAELILQITNFIQAFPGEISEIVIDALSKAKGQLQEDSRRVHAIDHLCAANKPTTQLEEKRERLKRALVGYTSMDHNVRQTLTSMGFEIDESGKHIKLTYLGDSRYQFILAKTGSDHRAGLNSFSVISKKVF